MPNAGNTAPVWSAPDQTGVPRSSSEFLGRWTVLYFYPEDDTPGCTKEACGFRDAWASLRAKTEVLGVSADSVESHRAFIKKYDLPFTLISDADRSLIAAFGADGVTLPKRTTFLIDPKGIVKKVYTGMDHAGHAREVEKDLDALIAAEQ